MDLNVRQIRAFVTVAKLGSFTRAAAVLHLSQPALTVQIRNLEETLGNRLLDRNSRGVEPTRIGRELLPMLERTLADLDSVLHDARELGGTRGGTVRIAALPSFAASLLPDLIRRCREAEPGLRFVVKDAVASAVNALVRNEDVDIGLTGGDFPDPEFEVVQRARDRLCLVYPQGHEVGRRRRITVKDIVALPLVLTAAGTSVRAVVDAAFAKVEMSPMLTCEPTYMMTAVAMVRAGLGLTILPGSSPEIRAEPTLQSRPIDDASFVRPIALIKKKGRTLPPASAEFLATCAKALRG
jgi:DNA-binding transcriptional LysR family regulator